MKSMLMMVVLALLVGGCTSATVAPGPSAAAWTPRTMTTTTEIIVRKKKIDGEICVKKTRTKNRNCRKHKDNESCNIPGDTVVWKWKKDTTDRPFKITMKSGFPSPFKNDAACTAQANEVTCKIRSGTVGRFYDYNVVVDTDAPPIPDCNLDPRFLIY